MTTLLECLRSLPDMTMRNLAAVRDEVANVAEHIERVHRDEDGYEVRKESHNYGRNQLTAVGFIGGRRCIARFVRKTRRNVEHV